MKFSKNLNNISIKSLETIYIEIPFEEQVKLNNEITKSLDLKQSNERQDINVKGEIRKNLQGTINIKINLKGNGLDPFSIGIKNPLKLSWKIRSTNMSNFHYSTFGKRLST